MKFKIKGKKNDAGKSMYHLIPFRALDEVVKVLTWGMKKYGENDWQHFVQRDQNELRYLSASLRHISARLQDENSVDEETKISHLAHAICCLLFALWKDLKKTRKEEE